MNRSAHFSSAAPRSRRAVAPARRPNHRPEIRPDHCRTSAILGQPAGHEPDDPDAPRSADDGRGIGRFAGDGLACLGDGRLHQVAPDEICSLERVGVDRGLRRIVGEEQPGGLEGLPHPSGCVQPRRDGERDRLQINRVRRDPCALQKRRDPGTWRGP